MKDWRENEQKQTENKDPEFKVGKVYKNKTIKECNPPPHPQKKQNKTKIIK